MNGNSSLTFARANLYTDTINSPIALNNTGTGTQAATIGETDAANTINLQGIISGTGDLKIAPGGNGNPFTVTLNKPETYSGNTFITQTAAGDYPYVKLLAGGSLPSTTALTVTAAGTAKAVTFDLNGQAQTLSGLSSAGAGAASDSIINSTNGTTSALTVNNTANPSYAGHIGSSTASTSNIALTKGASGTLILSGLNYYTGGTTIGGGAIQMSGSGTLGATTGSLTINTGGTLDLNGTSQTVGVLSGTSTTQAIGSGAPGTSTLTIGNGNGSGTFGGIIGDRAAISTGTPVVALTKTGTGAQALTGANGYSGITTLNGGILNINGQYALGGGNYSGLTFNGGTLQYATAFTGNGSGDISANSGGVAKPVTFGPSGATIDTNGNSVTFANTIGNSGTGSLTKSGSGTLTLGGANTYSGGVSLSLAAGTLNINNATALGTGALTIKGSSTTFDNTSGAALTLANGLSTIGGSATFTGTNDLTFSGALTLAGSNRRSVIVSNAGATLTFSGAVGQDVANRTLTKSGAGTLALTGTSTYSAGTDVAPGTNVTAGNLRGTTASLQGVINVNPNTATPAVLQFDQATAGTYAGLLKGSGALQKLNSGTLTLTGASTFVGATTVVGGTLQVGDGTTGSLASSPVTVQSGATLTGGTQNGATSTAGQVSTLSILSGGTHAPGVTSGVQQTGSYSLSSSSTLKADINGNAAGTGYDQVNVTGTVTLGGTLNLNLGYAPLKGDSFTLINNDGTDAVAGTFTGLAEGAPVSAPFGGTTYFFNISYKGGSGNDVVLTAAAPSAATGAIISEFRTRGPQGALDEFVELLNTTDSALNVSGWTLGYTSGAAPASVTLPGSTSIPARGYYLLANPGGTGTGYSLSSYASSDAALSSDIDDGSDLSLLNASGTMVDAASIGGAGSAPSSNGEFAFVRLPGSAAYSAFTLVSTDGSSFGSSLSVILGAPGPQSLSSPVVRGDGFSVALFDPGVSSSSRPNQVRVGATTGPNAPQGTLLIRRALTNSSGQSITRLRFRLVRLTTLGNTASPQADLRAISSISESRATSQGTKPVLGLTLEAPSTEGVGATAGGGTASGGGLNASLSSSTVTLSTPLAPNTTQNYNFLFRVVRPGSFAYALSIEALPTP